MILNRWTAFGTKPVPSKEAIERLQQLHQLLEYHLDRNGTLRRPGRFQKEISLRIPDEIARLDILQKICRVKLAEDASLREIARITPGFLGVDLHALIAEAAKIRLERLIGVTKTTKRNLGVKQVDEKLDKVVKWLKANDDPSEFDSISGGHVVSLEDFQIAHGRIQPTMKHEGILLCGPPGSGKTTIAKAIANETGISFLSVKGPELLNAYIGESEKAVRNLFQKARQCQPSIIFFDENDSLCPKRSQNENGGTKIVNQLLTEMDGIEGRDMVSLIGATNRPDVLDPAVLRTGRFGKILFVGFPNAAERADIMRKISKGGQEPKMDNDVDFEEISQWEKLNGFVGSDLNESITEASLIALQQRINQKDETVCEELIHPSSSANSTNSQ
ncbi:unnamed protein product [Caenorhabditis angaria]|uniref:AAA+ ATPase domain-containing protein n=1 Tax=Caenorhabditis angaria TaxID=860376 RepID=A0A9P1I9J1_9PELO|nr:unnamed protein product [Caenorhabditis angaria]